MACWRILWLPLYALTGNVFALWSAHISSGRPRGESLESALVCDHDKTLALAAVPTRLTGLDNGTQERLINWGYAVCDAAMRKHVLDVPLAKPDGFPYLGRLAQVEGRKQPSSSSARVESHSPQHASLVFPAARKLVAWPLQRAQALDFSTRKSISVRLARVW